MPIRVTKLLCIATLGLVVHACDKRPAKPRARPGAAKTEEPRQPAPPTPDAAATAEPPKLPVAGELEYLEVVLGDAASSDPLPMIVAIHGLGDAPQNFAHVFDSFPESARVILPRGVDAYEAGGWSWFPLRARDPDVEALAQGIESSAAELAKSIEILAEEKPTKGEPIVTGFSQGGMLAFTIAVKHPQVVGAAVPVGGWLPPPLWPATKGADAPYPKLVALHGTADQAVRFDGTEASVDHLEQLGFDVELEAYEGVPHVLTAQIQQDLQDRLVDAVRAAAK